ncbi:MAG: hypothetical protein AAGI89_02055 [Pseudomonadota bacterium]
MTKDQHNQPAETMRDGNLKATIWENQGEKGPYHSVSLAKTYQDKDGHLRDTNSFGTGDLLRVAELARSAYHRTNEIRREMQHDRDPADANGHDGERASRREAYQTKRSQGGGGRSPVPRRDATFLSDRFTPEP